MGAAIGGQAMNEAFGGEGADKLLVRLTGGLAFTFMFLAIMIGWVGNPNSTATDIDNPVIARNKDKNPELNLPSVNDSSNKHKETE